MQEVRVKTHLIVTDVHNEYHTNWCGKIIDANPVLNEQGYPVFIIIGSKKRLEVPTFDMEYLEQCARLVTNPKGRSSISQDSARIYIKEADGKKQLLGIFTHRRIKNFAPMYDKVGFR